MLVDDTEAHDHVVVVVVDARSEVDDGLENRLGQPLRRGTGVDHGIHDRTCDLELRQRPLQVVVRCRPQFPNALDQENAGKRRITLIDALEGMIG